MTCLTHINARACTAKTLGESRATACLGRTGRGVTSSGQWQPHARAPISARGHKLAFDFAPPSPQASEEAWRGTNLITKVTPGEGPGI